MSYFFTTVSSLVTDATMRKFGLTRQTLLAYIIHRSGAGPTAPASFRPFPDDSQYVIPDIEVKPVETGLVVVVSGCARPRFTALLAVTILLAAGGDALLALNASNN